MTATEDLFTPIHKAIRSMIYELGNRLQRTDFADPVASTAVLADLEHEFSGAVSSACILCLLHKHGGDEEAVPFPAMMSFDGALIRTLIEEHQVFSRQLAAISTLAHQLAQVHLPEARIDIGRRINQEVNGFFAGYLAHMNKEESSLVPAMREHFTDDQVRAMRSKIMGAMPRDQFAAYLRWMLPSLSLSELAGMLMGIKQGAPPELFRFVAGIGEGHVEPDRWTAVRARVGF